jgi:hypothetical protein
MLCDRTVTRAFDAVLDGDIHDGGWRPDAFAKTTFQQATEEKNG